MLVCGSNSSVFVRETCWYVVVIALCLYRAITTTHQHFSLTNTELWLPHTNISLLQTELWLPHTNISPLQTQSYNYYILTFLSYKHRAMTTTYQHFSLTNRAMTTTYQHFSLTNTELWLPHTNIAPVQTQNYDYHIPTFLPYKHRAMTTTCHHFSLTNTELRLPR
jgi:hypothetical protein